MDMKNTCQICEREIKAKTGVIAHHGYQRPDRGSGWQTESCFGARQKPYEFSCDAMQPYIDMVGNWLIGQKSFLESFISNPPEELSYRFPSENRLKRPEGFVYDTEEPTYPYRSYNTYENSFSSTVSETRRGIKNAEKEIERVSKRLANWKAQ
jgi:hypothetical protein